MSTVKRAAALAMATTPSAERLDRTEMFTFPAFLSVTGGAEGFVRELWGVVVDLRERRRQALEHGNLCLVTGTVNRLTSACQGMIEPNLR
jgi:hypothetical protein